MLGSLTAAAGSDWLGLIGSGPATLTGWRAIEPDTTDPRRVLPALSAVTRLVWTRDNRSA